MNTWKWSTGEIYYKSARPLKEKDENIKTQDYNSHKNAINQSLEDYPFEQEEYEIFSNNINNDFSNKYLSGTRREDIDSKISEREMFAQIGANPFLQQTSYVDDIVTRDMFLKPINTTQGRTKNKEKDE